MATIIWEQITSSGDYSGYTYRAKIFGGWLVAVETYGHVESGTGVSFVPDPEHEWDGDSL